MSFRVVGWLPKKIASIISGAVAVRALGGLLSLFVPVVGSTFNGTHAYGQGAALSALALAVLGPAQQFYMQGLLRAKVREAHQSERDGESLEIAALSISILYFAAIACAAALAVTCSFVDDVQAALFVTICAVVMVSKRFEAGLLSARRPSLAMFIFYCVAPTVQIIFSATPTWFSGSFVQICIAQIVAAFASSVLASRVTRTSLTRSQLLLAFHFSNAIRGMKAAKQFFLTGVTQASAEQLPTVVLGALGLQSSIANFEIAKKIASVVNIIVQGLVSQHGAVLIALAHLGDRSAFTDRFAKLRLQSMLLSIGYLGIVLTACLGLQIFKLLPMLLQLDVLFVLMLSLMISGIIAPYGIVLLSFDDERWIFIAALTGLIAQALISISLGALLGVVGVALGVLGQVAFTALLVFCRAHSILQR